MGGVLGVERIQLSLLISDLALLHERTCGVRVLGGPAQTVPYARLKSCTRAKRTAVWRL